MSFSTMKKIQSVTVTGATAANMEFTNIPGTFDDLVIKLSARSNRSALTDDIVYQYNNDTTSGRYSYRLLGGDGATAYSSSNASAAFDYAGVISGTTATSNTFSNIEIYIPNYAGSTQKSSSVDGVNENNSASGAYAQFIANLYNQTTAISSIKLYSVNSNSFVQYSTATLYGIRKS